MAAFNLWNSGPTYACTNHFRSLGFLLGRKEIIYKGNLHTGRRLHSVSRHKEHLQGEWKQVYSNYTRSWKQPGCLICSIFILCFSCIRIKCSNTSFKTVTNKKFRLENCVFLCLMKVALNLSKAEIAKNANYFP